MNNDSIVISGVGVWTPEYSINNEELVTAYNGYAEKFNAENRDQIDAGELNEKPLSSADFIAKASGIRSRYVYRKEGILDVNRMRPKVEVRHMDELSHQAEIALNAAKIALKEAKKDAKAIDAVIVSCSNVQRAYPAIAIEVQNELGVEGFGFDMLVACSAGTFALQRAYEMIKAGTANSVLLINPELTSPQVNYCNRDSHFIFGDVSVASIVETAVTATSDHQYEVIDTKAVTTYSNNIRADFGFVARAEDTEPFAEERLFHQEGRKVFKEVCPMVAEHIASQLSDLDIPITDVKRWWLHQANINMNTLIAKKLLGRMPLENEAPIVLDRYANTASAGSLIAFNFHHKDLKTGDLGLLCSFGAGYSIGSLVLRKC